jgi:CBS domain containing-hemolysin-like protein
LGKITDFFDQLLFRARSAETQGMTFHELRSLVRESAGESGLTEEEVRIVNSIFELSDMSVKTVMVPRTRMAFMKEDMDLKEAFFLAGKTKFSRFPVMGQDADDLKGMIYSKDLLSAFHGFQKASLIRDILKPAFFVPETKQAFELLREFQVNKMHMAIVLDEYGGAAGLVTLDDILGEVVGEFLDQHRPSSYRFQKKSDNLFIIDGNLSLQDFNELSGAALEDPDVETMAGYVIKLLGRIPQEEDEVQDLNFEFRIRKMEDKRVSEIWARRIQPTADDS